MSIYPIARLRLFSRRPNSAGRAGDSAAAYLPPVLTLISLLLISLSGAAVAAVDLNVEIDTASLAWASTPDGLVPELDGLPLLDEPGDPRLPYRDLLVVLPAGTRADGLRLVPGGVASSGLPGEVVRGLPARNSAGDELAWNRLEPAADSFPGVWGEILGTSVWHGTPVATVRIYPVRLTRSGPESGWSGLETAANFRVEVATAAETGFRARRLRPVPREHELVDSFLSGRVANPAALASRPAPMAAPAEEGFFAPEAEPSLEGSAVDYVIVTSDELAPEFQRLADFKTSRGITTVVRTIDWITDNYPAKGDLPATIRSFLVDAYQRWGTRFVLLGGDVEIIPARFIHSSFYPAGEGTEIPVDLYYSCLDGNWNADGDELLGEPLINSYDLGDDADLVAELYMGRAPVCQLTEAITFVDKVMAYERDGVGDHYGNILFLSEVLFPSDYTPGDSIDEDGAIYSEAIIDTLLAGSGLNSVRLYETSEMWPGSQPETYGSVMQALQSGEYGIVNHIGHGFFYNMSIGSTSLTLSDASDLGNSPHFFLLYGMNCASAAFDYNSIQERFLINPYGGAVFSLGSARASFPGTATEYQKEFYDVLLNDPAYMAGEVINLSRLPFDGNTAMNTLERWTHLNYVALGDPSLVVWTAQPGVLDVAVPDSLDYGPQDVTVTVASEGMPVAGALVCVAKGDDGYARAFTDAAGGATLSLTVKSAGEATVSVMGDNLRPAELTVPVRERSGSYLKFMSFRVVDDGSFEGTSGNGDGRMDSGETVGLFPTVRNTGGSATGECNLYFSSSDPRLNTLDFRADAGPLAPGAEAEAADPFLVQISSVIPDRETADCQLLLVDTAGEAFSDEYEAEILAPDLQVALTAWTDYGCGDGDHRIEPGEPIQLTFSLRNYGWGEADNLSAWIEPLVEGFGVHEGIGQWEAVPKLTEREQLDHFLITTDLPAAETKGVLHVLDGSGHEWLHAFDLDDPAQPEIVSLSAPAGGESLLKWGINDPDGDVYGYHVYRSIQPNGPFSRVTGEPVCESNFYRDIALDPMTKYFYRVAAMDSSRILGPQSMTASVSTSPCESSGFPINVPAETSSHTVVGDVNGDGELDAVLAADDVYVWDSRGIELRDGDGDPETLGPFAGISGEWGVAGVTLGNLTNRPGMEIVASCRSQKKIYVFQGDGSVAEGWPRGMSTWNWATPAVGDIDGDGDLEVVATTVNGMTYAWHHDGTEVLDGDSDPATDGVFQIRANEWYSYCSPLLADIDHDGADEILLISGYTDGSAQKVFALNSDGTDVPGWPFTVPGWGLVMSSISAADMDGDGGLEIVFATEGERLYVLQENGTVRDPFPITFTSNNNNLYAPGPAPAFGDIDQDGQLEIVAVENVSSHVSNLRVIGLDGQDLPGWPQELAGSSESSPLVADLTGNGSLDILFGIGGGSDSVPNYLYAYQAGGYAVPGFPLELTGPIRPTPALADFDNDGDIDILYGGWDLAMHVWDLPAPYVPELAPWPMFCADPLRSGVMGREWATAVDDPTPALSRAALLGNTPNPFNPMTRISFELPAGFEGRAKLTVYDARGRAVVDLIDGAFTGGRHFVDWRGTDAKGREVASGVYFYRLAADGEELGGKMTLVR